MTDLIYVAVFGVCCGCWLGRWAEARKWRNKAEGNPRYRMESGGKLYAVWPADEHEKMHEEWVAMSNAKMMGHPAIRGGGYACARSRCV